MPDNLALPEPGGGLAFLVAFLPFTLASILPPSPRPPSPPGKGETKGFFMQGASPLASPGLNPGGTGFSCGKRVPAAGLRPLRGGVGVALRCPEGGAGGWSPADLATVVPGGGLAFLVACLPFTLASILPPSPRPPSPPGKGETKGYFMQGASPLASPGLNPRFAAKTAGSDSLWAVPAAKERGDRGRWNYPSHATAAFEMVLSPGAGRASAARVQAGFKTHSRSG